MSVEVFQGRLRLRLPRQLGIKRYLTLGLTNTPSNQRIAEAKAKQMEADITLERFDPTLERYKPPSHTSPSHNGRASELSLSELWQKYTQFKAQFLSPTTINTDFRKVSNHIQALPVAKQKDAKAIRLDLLSRLSPDAARRVLMHLKACYQWACDEGLTESNPFQGIPSIRVIRNRTINPFTPQEQDLIIQAFSGNLTFGYYTPFVKFLFWTGCRTSEAIGLCWQHIAPGLETITFEEALVGKIRKDTKTHAVRKFPTNQALKDLLRTIKPVEWIPHSPVFKSKEGLTIDAHNFLNRAWRTILSQLPIKYRPQYNTRHTFITLCLDKGVPVAQVAAWAGNSPKTIWQHYAGLVSTIAVPEPWEDS